MTTRTKFSTRIRQRLFQGARIDAVLDPAAAPLGTSPYRSAIGDNAPAPVTDRCKIDAGWALMKQAVEGAVKLPTPCSELRSSITHRYDTGGSEQQSAAIRSDTNPSPMAPILRRRKGEPLEIQPAQESRTPAEHAAEFGVEKMAPGGHAPLLEILSTYRAWCKSRGFAALPDPQIGDELSELFLRAGYRGGRVKGQPAIIGVSLKQ